MSLRVKEWNPMKLQGACWILAGLLVVLYGLYDANYRYIWLVVGVAFVLYGVRVSRKVETPFQRRQRELRKTQL